MTNSEDTTKVTQALIWIKEILESEGVPYQIVGGMAAHLHGGKRPIHDIDLYIPAANCERVINRVGGFILKPLKHYVEDDWDIEYFQLLYNDQKIEIGLSPGGKFLDRATGEWIEQTIDFNSSITATFEGVDVNAMPKEELIRYKSLLNREVDRIDIAEISD